MFQMLVHPSSGACDLLLDLFHVLYCSGSMCVGVTVWFGWGGDIKLVYRYSTNKTMHGPINIRWIIKCLTLMHGANMKIFQIKIK